MTDPARFLPDREERNDVVRAMPCFCTGRIAEAIAGPATVRAIPGARHIAGSDRPDEVAQTIAEFLADGYGEGAPGSTPLSKIFR